MKVAAPAAISATRPRPSASLAIGTWATSPGERYGFETPPGIRVTTTTLEPAEAVQLAEAIHETVAAAPHASYLA